MTKANDIEIYVKAVKTETVETWLSSQFKDMTKVAKKKGMPKGSNVYLLSWNGQRFNAVVFEEVEPGFTSIWFNCAHLPWQNDEHCALQAAKYFDKPVRVTAGSWQQTAEPDAWLEITPTGESTSIVWPPT